MSCPYVGAKFRNQYLSHVMSNLGGEFFFSLPSSGQGDGCALDQMDLETN